MKRAQPISRTAAVNQDGSITVHLAPLSLRAEVVRPSSADANTRQVDLVWSTGADVERYDWVTGKRYIERLSLDPAHVKLDRLNSGAALLDSHSAWSVTDTLGACVPGTATLNKREGRVRVQFSRRPEVDGVWRDVTDGVIRHVSIGYRVYRFEEDQPKGNALPVRLATSWEPFEVSMVPIPADAGAMVRGEQPADANPCRIVMCADPAPSEVRTMPEREGTVAAEDQPDYIVERSEGPAPPAAPPREPNERDLGVQAERQRTEGIRNACRAARLPREFEDQLLRAEISLVEAQARVFEELRKRDMADQGPGGPAAVRIEVGDDPFVHKRAGIEAALCHRVAPALFKLDESARQYRGLGLMEVADLFLRARGLRLTSLSKHDRAGLALGLDGVRGGMHSTSDFPLLLADVARKVLRAAYEEAPQTWRPLAQPVSLTDFKASKQLQVGDAPDLLEVYEHGEFKSGTITEAREQIALKTYGRIFAITRQALINDDTGSFGSLPANFGRSARRLENSLAWAQITSNPTMGDGVVLFHSSHGNLAASGGAISITTLGAGRQALRVQKGIDGTTPLNLSARSLIVPAALETVADQFVTQLTPAQASNANPFGPNGRTPLTPIVEPLLDAASATAWYLAADAASAPVLLYGTLDGQSGPAIEQRVGFEVDGLQIKCRHDVAFKAADHRAIYKNPGA